MRKQALGQSGIDASVIGLGTWAIGGWSWGGTNKAASIDAIHASIDAGINLIDTAPIYGMGLSEEIVGEAIQGKRDQVVLSTKCGLRWDIEQGEFAFEDGEGHRIYKYNAAAGITEEIERSLKRLRTDFIDLYHVHWPDATTPIEETITTLLKLKAAGKIGAIGVSNVTSEMLTTYLEHGSVDCIQEMFSMVDQMHVENGLFSMAAKNNISILAYSPLAMGLLSGKMQPDRIFPEGDSRKHSPRFTPENRQKTLDLLGAFKDIADKYQLSIAQLVIAWSTYSHGVTHVLTGARDAKQALENAQAGSTEIAASDLQAMDQILAEHALKLPHPFLPEEA